MISEVGYYFDEDSMDLDVAGPLRAEGLVDVTASDAGPLEAPDDQQLTFATVSKLVVYTANVGHFARLHTEWMRSGRSHAGIVVRVRQQLDVGSQIRALLQLAEQHASSGLADTIIYL